MTTTAHAKPWARRRSGPSRETPRVPNSQVPQASHTSARPGRFARLVLGAENDPNWARPSLLALLALAAVVYCWDLTNSGYANEFYAAAVKSGTKSWEAWFFGSLDSSNAITVDKPPASLWVMGLSARLFGFSSFSLLIPQALMGIGTVSLTYGAVRRWSGHAAGLLGGLIVTLTPVAALMFRFDNPDAMLVLLMTAAAYFVVRALGREDENLRARTALAWMVGAGLLIGFAFLTKMLQGLLVLPGLGMAYLVAARYSLRTRIAHLLSATFGVLIGAGWLIAVEAAWPAASRPYIGGSTNNSLWDLAIGYNGLGRILGGSGNAGGMGGGGGGFGGTAGLLRMFNSQFGGEISWLLPTSLILLTAGFVARGRAPRTDRARASLIMWAGWLLVTAICLSFMEGTVHSYYAVALVPAIAACIAVGGHQTWLRRDSLVWRCVTAVSICVAAIWSFRLLSTTAPSWMPWLRWVSVVLAMIGAMMFVACHAWGTQRIRRLATVGLIVGVLGALGGSAAWTFSTVATGHTGSMPTAGPVAGGGVMGGSGNAPGNSAGQMGASSAASGSSSTKPSGSAPTGNAPRSGQTPPEGAQSDMAPSDGTPSGAAPNTGTSGAGNSSANGQASQGGTTSYGSTTSQSQQAGSAGGAMGGGAATNNTALTKLLNATDSKWSAAVIGDQSAAGYILNSNTAVMSIGGWSGSDNNVTLAQFQAYVKAGDIHYFIAGGGMGGGQGGNGLGSQITAWVKAHFKATSVGGATVYDLTQAA